MHAKIVTFAAGALFVLGNAVPLNNGKRDLVWVTEIATAVETIPVTTTVWVDPTPTAEAHNHHRHKHSSANSQPAIEVKPTPSPASSSSSEAPVAPVSSYEAPPAPYVAPTTSTPEPEPATTAQVASLLADAELAVVLHEEGSTPLATTVLPVSGEIVLVVGPEGGVTEAESTAFAQAGAAPYRLGPSVLRTSTAGTAAAALLLGRSGRWS